jgi:propanol-preferring alcohol dehydrogenase
MRAAQIHAYGSPLSIDRVPDPKPRYGEVLVRIAGAGICHSDLHTIEGKLPLVPRFPWILGHENAGYVEALGPGAGGFERGEPVAVFGGWGCGTCRYCISGDEQLCDLMSWGGHGKPGGYAEFIVVPSTRHLVRLGDLDPIHAAPLTDAALTPYRAVRRALREVPADGALALIGFGGLGQYALQVVRLFSPAQVIIVDRNPAKRARATEANANAVIDPDQADAPEELRRLAGGEGVDAVIDLVGSDDSLALAAAVTRRRGIVILVGLAGGSLRYSFKGVRPEVGIVTSSWGNRRELGEVIELASRGLLTGQVETLPLEAINEAFERLARGDVAGRAVLVPGAVPPTRPAPDGFSRGSGDARFDGAPQ